MTELIDRVHDERRCRLIDAVRPDEAPDERISSLVTVRLAGKRLSKLDSVLF